MIESTAICCSSLCIVEKCSVNNQLVAVKSYFVSSVGKYERDIHSQLDHKNIVRYISDVEEFKDEDVTITEFQSQGTLEGMSMSPDRCLEVIHQLAEGLVYLHGLGMAHTSIQTSHLLLGNDSQIKICNFAHTRVHKRISPVNAILGSTGVSPHMYAPEMANLTKSSGWLGFETLDCFKFDIWCMGIVLLEILQGKKPWGNIFCPEYLDWRDNQEHSQLAKTVRSKSEHIYQLVKMMLNEDPKCRPSAEELVGIVLP